MTNTKLIIATLIAVPVVCAVGFFAGTYTAIAPANGYSDTVQSQYADQNEK